MNTIKTVIIDDETRSLNRLKLLLHHFKEIELLGIFENADQGIDCITKHEPDLVLLDIEMPLKSGIEVAKEINKLAINTKIIFVSAHEHYAIKAIKARVFDYLLKPVCIDELKLALQRFTTHFKINLNQRELQVIKALSQGFNSKAIGEKYLSVDIL